ncbi:hypothetical protein [Roseovarius sp. ZX-A-9]|uniref:hypothetical protein n=1 Tax=Roseovarius sp. ZX-A-9 TaxID=3014783 RepID=UPI00232C11EF|nr:hypothetical protein [Roseovarius sp. ZX-A-9]
MNALIVLNDQNTHRPAPHFSVPDKLRGRDDGLAGTCTPVTSTLVDLAFSSRIRGAVAMDMSPFIPEQSAPDSRDLKRGDARQYPALYQMR